MIYVEKTERTPRGFLSLMNNRDRVGTLNDTGKTSLVILFSRKTRSATDVHRAIERRLHIDTLRKPLQQAGYAKLA